MAAGAAPHNTRPPSCRACSMPRSTMYCAPPRRWCPAARRERIQRDGGQQRALKPAATDGMPARRRRWRYAIVRASGVSQDAGRLAACREARGARRGTVGGVACEAPPTSCGGARRAAADSVPCGTPKAPALLRHSLQGSATSCRARDTLATTARPTLRAARRITAADPEMHRRRQRAARRRV
ncbi:hypothetical protein BC834DRAFT_890977 [Gloeopeniophorella convolvens]|nr:hypothetical protein BC834DRAFT_890977 [Gloeopeniophorella convolvens]